MRTHRTRAVVCALLATAVPGALLATSCDKKNDDSAIIGRLLNRPSDFADKELSITGKVVNSFDPSSGLLGLAAYQIEDQSGRIWVISRAGSPSVGQEVRLKARLRRDPLPVAIYIPGVSVTLLDELERQKK